MGRRVLQGAGLQPSDRIGMLAKNRIEYALLYFAASKAGVVPVPLNYRSAPAEWTFVLNDSEARMLLAAAPYTTAIDAMRANVSGVEHFVALDGGEAEWIDFVQWTHGQPDDDVSTARTDSEADFVQIYTSGTTGQPKGAVLTQRSVVSNVLQISTAEHRGPPGERSLVVGPMLHAGMVWSVLAPLAWGASIFIVEDFDASNVARILDTQDIGYAALAPTILQACVRVAGAAEREYASLRLIQCGSSALAEETLRRATSIFKCQFADRPMSASARRSPRRAQGSSREAGAQRSRLPAFSVPTISAMRLDRVSGRFAWSIQRMKFLR
jgi:acyl-CoA synthetase (AMP-forming)/AMP-acid ligase II